MLGASDLSSNVRVSSKEGQDGHRYKDFGVWRVVAPHWSLHAHEFETDSERSDDEPYED